MILALNTIYKHLFERKREDDVIGLWEKVYLLLVGHWAVKNLKGLLSSSISIEKGTWVNFVYWESFFSKFWEW